MFLRRVLVWQAVTGLKRSITGHGPHTWADQTVGLNRCTWTVRFQSPQRFGRSRRLGTREHHTRPRAGSNQEIASSCPPSNTPQVKSLQSLVFMEGRIIFALRHLASLLWSVTQKNSKDQRNETRLRSKEETSLIVLSAPFATHPFGTYRSHTGGSSQGGTLPLLARLEAALPGGPGVGDPTIHGVQHLFF